MRVLLSIPFLFLGCAGDDGETLPGATDVSTADTATGAPDDSTTGEGESMTGPDAVTSASDGSGSGESGTTTTTGPVATTGEGTSSSTGAGASPGGAYDPCDEDEECAAGPCSLDATTCPDGMFCNGVSPGPPAVCEYP